LIAVGNVMNRGETTGETVLLLLTLLLEFTVESDVTELTVLDEEKLVVPFVTMLAEILGELSEYLKLSGPDRDSVIVTVDKLVFGDAQNVMVLF